LGHGGVEHFNHLRLAATPRTVHSAFERVQGGDNETREGKEGGKVLTLKFVSVGHPSQTPTRRGTRGKTRGGGRKWGQYSVRTTRFSQRVITFKQKEAAMEACDDFKGQLGMAERKERNFRGEEQLTYRARFLKFVILLMEMLSRRGLLPKNHGKRSNRGEIGSFSSRGSSSLHKSARKRSCEGRNRLIDLVYSLRHGGTIIEAE